MHYRGQVWRPPFEAGNALLQVASGCMHNKCKFCSLYHGTSFRISPMSEIETDLKELSKTQKDCGRIFLTGANPLGLSQNRLIEIAGMIKYYLPGVTSIGGFARIADIKRKTQEELNALQKIGFDGISFGTETGDDMTLAYMNKGNTAADIVAELGKLDKAGISYNIVFMNGLAGEGNGGRHALESARIFNQTNPASINIVALTVFPESELYDEVMSDKFKPSSELEKLKELKNFIENLTVTTRINANTISNAAPFTAELPRDKAALIKALDEAVRSYDESELKAYRNNIKSL